jgi:cation diffusion facilitator family transporter
VTGDHGTTGRPPSGDVAGAGSRFPEPVAPAALDGRKASAARLSIGSNSALILMKLVAGAVTGSIAIITEAVHSSIDLLASIVAYFSVRKADEPADESHLYGHAKAENLAAALEGALILVGAGVIVFEAVRRLVNGSDAVDNVGFGIVVIGVSTAVNVVVSSYLYRQAAIHDSPALEGDAAHLRADALTSLAVVVGLVLIEVTGVAELDSIVALMVAAAIVYAGVRIVSRSSRMLMDEAIPAEELDVVRKIIEVHCGGELAGYHKLRARRAGSARYIDVHLQFARGTSLERAHSFAHSLQAEIQGELRNADVLVHIEPAREGEEEPPRAAG